MKLLLTTQPGAGHVYPAVALGQALQARGATVFISTADTFSRTIADAGLTPLASGISWSEADVARFFPEIEAVSEKERAFWMEDLLWRRSPKAMLPDICRQVEQIQPDAIVSNDYDWSGKIAARHCKLPFIQTHIAAQIPGFEYENLFADNYAELSQAFPPAENPAPSLALNFMPPCWTLADNAETNATHYFKPLLYDARHSYKQSQQLHRSGKPLVFMNFGTVTNKNIEFLTTVGQAVTAYGAQLVVGTGMPDSPLTRALTAEDVHIFDFIPQSLVLPDAQLCINHGGVSTVMGCLSHAVPMIVFPFGADQPMNYKVCRSLSVCPELPRSITSEIFPGFCVTRPTAVTFDVVTRLIEQTLSESAYRESTQRVHNQIDSLPDASEAHPIIEAFLNRSQ